MKNLKEERLGEINVSNEGYEMKIIKYKEANNIVIEFQDKYKAKINTTYQNFKKGEVKNPYCPSVFNRGYIGIGKYKVRENGKNTETYEHWRHMIQRCYDPYFINKDNNIVYKDIIVCDEWLCFQNFAKWFYKNYYKIEGDILCLDKDILIKGNKIYSPETCLLVPNRINILFTRCDKLRGIYPIGVHWDRRTNKFVAQCSILDKNDKQRIKNLGYYSVSEEAFLAYKNFKEKYIKQVADKYKDIIPQKLYEALYKYEVEIND